MVSKSEGEKPTVRDKVQHVLRARQSRKHTCHWPGCTKQVPPAKWGCKLHWFKLPRRFRMRVWELYIIGQEETMTPSKEYLELMADIQRWIQITQAKPVT